MAASPVRALFLAALVLAQGCRSGVPWRTAEFTLTAGASATLDGKAGVTGASLMVKVETKDNPASTARIALDRGLPTERTTDVARPGIEVVD